MTDLTESEVVEVGDLDPDQWNDFAIEQGWSDGFPLMAPTASFNSVEATLMRSASSSAFNPPTGCLTISSLGSALRALAWERTSGRKVSVMTM